MSNKIQGYGQPAIPAAGTRTNPVEGVTRGDGQPVEPVSQARDSVSVSDSALLMQRLEEAIAKASPEDVSRIEQIKQALARGEYNIDSQRIADKMLKLERDLVGR